MVQALAAVDAAAGDEDLDEDWNQDLDEERATAQFGRATGRSMVKVAFSASAGSMDSEIDARFGRAPYFVVVDTEAGGVRTLDNIVNMEAGQGAGIKAAESVVREGVDSVVTGHCGPKAFRVLSAAGIGVYLVSGGTIGDALIALQKGDLERVDGADSQSHW